MAAEPAEQHRQVLERFWEGFSRRHRDRLGPAFSENAVWHIPPYYVRLYGEGDARGRDAILNLLLGRLPEFYQPHTIQLQRMFLIADEQFGAIQFINRCKMVNDVDYENIYVFAFRFDNGRIGEGWEHLDSAWFNHLFHGRD